MDGDSDPQGAEARWGDFYAMTGMAHFEDKAWQAAYEWLESAMARYRNAGMGQHALAMLHLLGECYVAAKDGESNMAGEAPDQHSGLRVQAAHWLTKRFGQIYQESNSLELGPIELCWWPASSDGLPDGAALCWNDRVLVYSE